MNSSNGSDYNGNGYHYPHSSRANSGYGTPVPDHRDYGPIGPPRYVPPMRRNDNISDRVVRPESSLSNATFATQVNVPTPYRGPQSNAMTGYSPQGTYSYGPSQLTQHMSAFDPFTSHWRGASQQQVHQQYSQQQPPTYVGQYYNGPMQSTNVYSNVPVGQNGKMNVMSNYHQGMMPTPREPSTQSSPNDSAVVNTRAMELAARIRAGHANDPTDPMYGRAGFVSETNVAPQTNIGPEMPVPRGIVAAESIDLAARGYNMSYANVKGNSAAFQGTNTKSPPEWLPYVLKGGFTPTIDELMHALPMIEACRVARPSTAGVVRIKNIPYATTRSEITAFLGRNAHILNQPVGSPYHAVHILVDRHTCKTMDAFIELDNVKEAQWIVGSFSRRIASGRHSKLGDRNVTVEMSSMGDFMAELFPRAKNVEWEGSIPKINNTVVFYYENVPAQGFNGFLQDEEICHMVKHAETPQRVSDHSPCRC